MPLYQVTIEKRQVRTVKIRARDRWGAEYVGDKICLEGEKVVKVEPLEKVKLSR